MHKESEIDAQCIYRNSERFKVKQQKESPFPLRLERDLKSWLRVRARVNKRSLNGEIDFVLSAYRQQQEGQRHA